ncbi:hypothetical protein Pmani_037697 [Petrolisthes manimaculis]|uniref:Uncharacterized protein n=1 Tax=Petrolisthes manimaculis TaxID=1843537 RepID=A0AAE1TN21_9EUCA|nr:hypothetical protein Pmani_037697 [Petrolisthes manimaculis]
MDVECGERRGKEMDVGVEEGEGRRWMWVCRKEREGDGGWSVGRRGKEMDVGVEEGEGRGWRLEWGDEKGKKVGVGGDERGKKVG